MLKGTQRCTEPAKLDPARKLGKSIAKLTRGEKRIYELKLSMCKVATDKLRILQSKGSLEGGIDPLKV